MIAPTLSGRDYRNPAKRENCGAIRNLVGIRGDGPGGDMGEEARLDTGEDKVGRTGRLALPATRVSPPSSHASTL